jgi:hypothetical protein
MKFRKIGEKMQLIICWGRWLVGWVGLCCNKNKVSPLIVSSFDY